MKSAYRTVLAKRSKSHSFKWAVIEPDMLPGEDVLFVSEYDFLKEAQAANPGLVTYLLEEMHYLPPASDAESLRKIHMLKKMFGGWMRPLSELAASTV